MATDEDDEVRLHKEFLVGSDYNCSPMEDNNIVPAIDRTYPLNETAEAMRYFEDEHAIAKL